MNFRYKIIHNNLGNCVREISLFHVRYEWKKGWATVFRAESEFLAEAHLRHIADVCVLKVEGLKIQEI